MELLNPVLYMEVRLFADFIRLTGLRSKEANSLFEDYGIWEYIEECYEVLSMSGDESIMNDILEILEKNGVKLEIADGSTE